MTTEALDLCLEKGILTPEQHWCGIHFRWLYTLRYGAPGIRAIDPTHLGGIDRQLCDPQWRTAREVEFNEAIHTLRIRKLDKILIDLAIFNEKPSYISKELVNNARNRSHYKEWEKIIDAFDILKKLWS